MPKVKFIVPSHEQIAERVYGTVRELKENYKRIIYLDLNKELYDRILAEGSDKVKADIIKEIKEKHNLKELEKYKKELEEYWRPFNGIFFDGLKKITGFDFKFEEYAVYITNIIRGSYTTDNRIYTNPMKSMKVTVFIVCEELLHLHYWGIFRKLIKDTEIPWQLNKDIWEISETIPEFVLTDDLFKKFGFPKELGRNYPFLKQWKDKLTPLWENKKNFKEFIIKVNKS